MTLPPLPAHPPGARWPTHEWRLGSIDDGEVSVHVDQAADALFATPEQNACGRTDALLVVNGSELVLERYRDGHSSDDTFHSWSMAKSITHALVGILVHDGRVDPGASPVAPAWRDEGDPRSRITLEDLLRMVDGLAFVEADYEARRFDVVEMIQGAGESDTAAWAQALPLACPPGQRWSYSSAATLLVCALLGRIVGGGREGMEAFMRARLFDPIGMRSAKPRFDKAGTYLGSSFLFATPRDFARFGLLYLRDGEWDGERILPRGWVDHARTPTAASQGAYGAHWWLAQDGSGIFTANGFQGQYIVLVPTRDLVVVRLGASSRRQRPVLERALARLVSCFPVDRECARRRRIATTGDRP
jgi:CubicO group peptidase (beta-lactamase class C family)